MKTQFRSETDSMGEVRVPADAYHGAQTARALENFPISGLRFSRAFIRALGLIKKLAAATHAELGLLDRRLARAIQQAAQEVVDGKLDAKFVVDIFQTGSGTSANMNAIEVIANRAAELLGGRLGDRTVHPNDHVNRGQSSNDVIPTSIHLAALEGIETRLLPALEELEHSLAERAEFFKAILNAQVFGNEAVVALAGASGSFELNTLMPVLAYNPLQAIELLSSASRLFARRCVAGLEADALRCQSNV